MEYRENISFTVHINKNEANVYQTPFKRLYLDIFTQIQEFWFQLWKIFSVFPIAEFPLCKANEKKILGVCKEIFSIYKQQIEIEISQKNEKDENGFSTN